MTNIITEILAEVIRIFGIATKELKRGSASELPISCVRTFTKSSTEKFLRRLAGMADLEDALKKLDRLTQEEARMAHAEALRMAHSIRNEVKVVDDKVQVAIDGARGLSNELKLFPSNNYAFRRKGSGKGHR